MAVTLVKSAPAVRRASPDSVYRFNNQSTNDFSKVRTPFGRINGAVECVDLGAFRRLIEEQQHQLHHHHHHNQQHQSTTTGGNSTMMKQQQMGGPTLSLKGGIPPAPHMAHTLPMTHRSQYGGPAASKGRLGAYSAIGGGSFAPSLSASSFFTRHNPHPGRVRHIKGLLDVPICHVSDDGFQPKERPLMTPERRSIYQAYKVPSSVSQFPLFPTNSYGVNTYDVFHTKGIPYKKVPMVPRWFEELKDISNRAGLEPSFALEHQQQQAQKASYSKVTGRLNEAPSRAMSRSGATASRAGRLATGQSRQGQFTGGINKQPDNEALVMELLSQILQSDSISAIQQWLTCSSDRVPMVPRWFEELKDISNRAGLEPSLALEHQQQQAQKASYSKVTGRLNEAPSRAMSRSGATASRAGRLATGQSRQGQFTGGINKQPDNEALVMELLSQILQTDSISAIQQWLTCSSDRDKDIVSDMIRAALATEQQVAANSMPDPYNGAFQRDEFLENKPSNGAASVDRLVVDDPSGGVEDEMTMPAQVQQTKLPDINQPRTTSRLSDQLKQQQQMSQMHARFEGLEPLAENEQEFVEYRNLDNMAGGDIYGE